MHYQSVTKTIWQKFETLILDSTYLDRSQSELVFKPARNWFILFMSCTPQLTFVFNEAQFEYHELIQ